VPEIPAYLRIAADIRAGIVAGNLAPGDKIPTETALMADYLVSRTVAKNAVLVLKGEGLVEGRRGSGVYVRSVRRLVRHAHSRDMRSKSGSTSPFARDATGSGHQGGWDHHSEHATADLETARRLAVEPGAPVMTTQYVFRADGEPIQVSWSREPLELTEGTPVEWPEDGTAVGVVARFDFIGVHIDECEERVRDRPASPEEIEALQLPARLAHVQTIERTYLAHGRPVETADIVFPVGRYEIVYRFPVD
jgi:GntR family transcriptional regulator